MIEIKTAKISHRIAFADVDPAQLEAMQDAMNKIGRQIATQMCAIPDELLAKPKPPVNPLESLLKFRHQPDVLEKRGVGRDWIAHVNPAALSHVVDFFDKHYAGPTYPEKMPPERKAEIVLGRPVKIDVYVEWIEYRKPPQSD